MSELKRLVVDLCKTPLGRGMTSCGLPAKADEIRRLETALHVKLPVEYVAFLVHFNGGECRRGTLTIKDSPLSPGYFEFFGLNCEWAQWRDLGHAVSIHDGRVPAGTIPIGLSGGDNAILLSLDDGHIGIWERDAELETNASKNWTKCSDSFGAFAQDVTLKTSDELRAFALSDDEPEQSIEVDDLLAFREWTKRNAKSEWQASLADFLALACEEGSYSCARFLLKEVGVGASIVGSRGATPIELADENGQPNLVVLLLENGADQKDLTKDGRVPEPITLAFATQFARKLRASTPRYKLHPVVP